MRNTRRKHPASRYILLVVGVIALLGIGFSAGRIFEMSQMASSQVHVVSGYSCGYPNMDVNAPNVFETDGLEGVTYSSQVHPQSGYCEIVVSYTKAQLPAVVVVEPSCKGCLVSAMYHTGTDTSVAYVSSKRVDLTEEQPQNVILLYPARLLDSLSANPDPSAVAGIIHTSGWSPLVAQSTDVVPPLPQVRTFTSVSDAQAWAATES